MESEEDGMIVVDSRENSKMKVEEKIKDVTVSPLEVGDYIIQGLEKNIIIERKTVQDLISSSYDRLWSQLKALANSREQGYEPYLVVEMNYIFNPKVGKPTTLNVFFKCIPEKEMTFYSILYATSLFHVPILYTKDFQGTCKLIEYLNEKIGKPKEKKELPERVGFKKDWNIEKKREYWFEAFGCEFARVYKNVKLKDILSSPLSREQVLEKLPKHYTSGRTIPTKKIEEFLQLLGFSEG